MRKTRGIKPPFVDWYILEKVEKVRNSERKNTPVKIYSRRSTILSQFVGFNFEVHNGKSFMPLYIIEGMIGYKFGEFIPTRKFVSHSGGKDPRSKNAKNSKTAKTAKPAAKAPVKKKAGKK